MCPRERETTYRDSDLERECMTERGTIYRDRGLERESVTERERTLTGIEV